MLQILDDIQGLFMPCTAYAAPPKAIPLNALKIRMRVKCNIIAKIGLLRFYITSFLIFKLMD